MNREKVDRAAQFAPFDALKGLQEELRKREEEHSKVEKKELSEEEMEELSQTILKLEKGDRVRALFFYLGRYVELSGILTNKNTTYKYITIDDSKLFFDDIVKLEII